MKPRTCTASGVFDILALYTPHY